MIWKQNFLVRVKLLTVFITIIGSGVLISLPMSSTEGKQIIPIQMLNKTLDGKIVDNGTFTVVATLYGVRNTTGNVVVFFALNDTSMGRIVNATTLDVSDGRRDGIADVILGLGNATIKVGEKFQVCAMPFNEQNLVCSMRHNAPSLRYEYVDLSLSNDAKQ